MTTNQTGTSTRQQCRHIHDDSRRCGSPCLRGEPFCYQHHTTRRRRPIITPMPDSPPQAFPMPMIEDRAAIQNALYEVLGLISTNFIDLKRAQLILYGLQIASSNLPKPAAAQPAKRPSRSYRDEAQSADQTDTKAEPVEDIAFIPGHGYLAPETEYKPAAAHRYVGFAQALLNEIRQKPSILTESGTPPNPIPTLQATAETHERVPQVSPLRPGSKPPTPAGSGSKLKAPRRTARESGFPPSGIDASSSKLTSSRLTARDSCPRSPHNPRLPAITRLRYKMISVQTPNEAITLSEISLAGTPDEVYLYLLNPCNRPSSAGLKPGAKPSTGNSETP